MRNWLHRIGESPNALSGRGLLGLNGFMAGFCALLALTLAVAIAAAIATTLLTSVISLPEGTRDWSAGPLEFHFTTKRSESPGWVMIKNCRDAAGKETCMVETRPLRPEDIKPDPVGSALDIIFVTLQLAPLAALVFGLVEACRCFINLARGRFFDRGTVSLLRNFAFGGLVFVLLYPNRQTVAEFVGQLIDGAINQAHRGVTVHHGVLPIDVGLTPGGTVSNVLIVVYALALTVMAAVMAKAAAVAEDHAQIV